ncbi:MAG: LysR family transcriptional regulator [Pseudomonadota bacterium]
MSTDLDWTLLKSFTLVAEHGSFTAAAKAGGGSQPTLGRHIAALEADLGVVLFNRAGGGLTLTETGVDLLEHARAMADAAGRLSLAAEGRSEALAGSVRITASQIVASFVLPQILTALRIAEPEIDIEVVASDRTENLLQREADIAVRMYRPVQADVIARKVGDMRLGLFAARDYLNRRGEPTGFDDLERHDFVGYDRSDLMIKGFRAAGVDVDRDFFPFRSDDQVVCWQMVVAGFGIGANQIAIGEAEPRVARVLPDVDIPPLPIWLTAHAELKTSRRVRRVFDFLAEALAEAAR